MYWESRKGKAGWSETSYTSSCSDPAGELSPSEGVGEHSFLFREEEEAMEYLCKHNEVKEKERDGKKKEQQKEAKRKNGKVKDF